MLTQEQIVELKATSPEKRNGVECHFLRMNNRWGLKYWWHEQSRDNSYLIQKLAHKLGFAPAVGKKIDFELDGEQKFGYITEAIVETLYDWMAFYHRYTEMSRWELQNRLDEHIWNIRNAVYDATNGFIEPCDNHYNNYGFNTDGDIVCIDFGGWLCYHDGHPHDVSCVKDLESKLNERSIHV